MLKVRGKLNPKSDHPTVSHSATKDYKVLGKGFVLANQVLTKFVGDKNVGESGKLSADPCDIFRANYM